MNNANARNNIHVFSAFPNERDNLNANNTNNNHLNRNYDVESYIEDDEDDDVLARHLQIWTSMMMNDSSKIPQPTNTLNDSPQVNDKMTTSQQSLQRPLSPTPHPASHLSHSNNVHSFANSLEKMVFNEKSEDSLMAHDNKYNKAHIFNKNEVKNDSITTGSLPLLNFDCSQKQVRNLPSILNKDHYEKKNDQIKHNDIIRNKSLLASSSSKLLGSKACSVEDSDNLASSKSEMTKF